MPGLAEILVLAVARVRPTFRDRGDALGGSDDASAATGFWLADKATETPIFVTNKHVVERRMSDATSPFRLDRLEIELRRKRLTPPFALQKEVRFCAVTNLEGSLFVSADADCAIICRPSWDGAGDEFAQDRMIDHTGLADAPAFRSSSIEVTDRLAFIGYPCVGNRRWWDVDRTLPIVREATIACPPGEPFVGEDLPAERNAMLVSGLSFLGSSGSPVFTLTKYELHPRFYYNNSAEETVPLIPHESRLIGIMSGHFRGRDTDVPSMFRHGGLSYLVRSPSILALIDAARASGWTNPNPYDGLESVRNRLAGP